MNGANELEMIQWLWEDESSRRGFRQTHYYVTSQRTSLGRKKSPRRLEPVSSAADE